MNMTAGLTPEAIERLNACMRPSDDIRQKKLVIVLALLRELDTLENDDLRLAALAHIFDAYEFAYFSGPQTPAEAFPSPSLPVAGSSEERAFFEAITPTDKRAFAFATAQLLAGIDPVSVVNNDSDDMVSMNSGDTVDHWFACARYALRRLREETTQERRAGFLALMLGSHMFCLRSQPPATPLSDPAIDDAYYQAALQRNHAAIHEALWSLRGPGAYITTVSQVGGGILDVLSRVADLRDRACILGFVIEQWKTCSTRELIAKRGAPVMTAPWDDPTIDGTYYDNALWRNRAMIREALWHLPGVGSYDTAPSQVGGGILDVLSRVVDLRDRACVLGFVIEQWRGYSAEELAGRQGLPVSVDLIPKPVETRDRSTN